MSEVLLHEKTREALEHFAAKPSHAVAIIGLPGVGKTYIAQYLASKLLNIGRDKLTGYPYFKLLTSPEGKSIPIESVRDVTHFLTLKTAARADISRLVLIEHAQLLTHQAQNALLKTIEEPPSGTVLILTCTSELDLLPTISSRIQKLYVQAPAADALRDHFMVAGYPGASVDKAMLMSGHLPGLTQALLAEDTAHPLINAAARARDLLQKSTFDRLLMIDDLVKDKQAWLDTLFMLQRMATVALENTSTTTAAVRRWHHVLQVSHRAHELTIGSAQVKLTALHFMLNL